MGKLDTFGCACRCLLKLRERRGFPLSEDDFLKQFSLHYPHWNMKCGLADTAIICELAKNMGLAIGVQAVRNYASVMQAFNENTHSGILVCVERFRDNQGQLSVLYHCMLLEHIDKSSFSLWCPFQDGTSASLPPFPVSDWDIFLSHVP